MGTSNDQFKLLKKVTDWIPMLYPITAKFHDKLSKQPISVKQLVHFAQIELHDDIRKFDYGEQNNLKKYGEKLPPKIPIEQIQVPIQLWVG